MLALPDGTLALKRAADSVPVTDYARVVAAVRADHEDAYGCRSLITRVFGASVETIVLDRDTQGPADTVAHMVRLAGVTGAIAIKDCDSFFTANPLPPENFVAVADIRGEPDINNVGAKSFAVLDAAGDVVDIVEKRIVSNHICVGLYGFADAAHFLEHFAHAARAQGSSEIFLSHVFASAISDGTRVLPQTVSGYVDVGTIEDWKRYIRITGNATHRASAIV